MASKSTNSTILTVAFVGIVAFIVWKIFGKKTSSQASTSGLAGVSGGYQAPDDLQQQSQDPISSLLNSLLGLFGKGGSGSGGSGSGASGKGNPANSNPYSSGDSNTLDLTTPLGEALSGYDSVDGESFSQEGTDLINSDWFENNNLATDLNFLNSSGGQYSYDLSGQTGLQTVNDQFPIQGTSINSAAPDDDSASAGSGNYEGGDFGDTGDSGGDGYTS